MANETKSPKAPSANAILLFDLYAKDSGNWGGTPLVNGNVTLLGDKEDRGLLTNLKRAGLITTYTDNGTFVAFTDAGVAFAAERGIKIVRF